MKYFRLFLNHSDHEVARVALEKLEMYLSYCEDNKDVTLFYLKKSKYAVGDYLLSSMQVVKNADITNEQKSNVIGVCVIPDNFISQNGENAKARFCALADLNVGGSEFIPWTKTGYSINLTTKSDLFHILDGSSDWGLPCIAPLTSENDALVFDTILKLHCMNTALGYFAYLMNDNEWLDNNYGNELTDYSEHIHLNIYDDTTYYYCWNDIHTEPDGDWGGCFASPYLSNNKKNDVFFSTLVGFNNEAALMNGKEITDWMVNYSKNNTDISFDAANACANYRNNSGWYLGSIGEWLFVMARFTTIQNAISKVGGTTCDTYNDYWSSTLYSADYACSINTGNGGVDSSYKNNNYRVRPFLRLD